MNTTVEDIAEIFQRWRERAEQRGEYIGTRRWLVQQLINRGFARIRLTGGVKAIGGLALRPKDFNQNLPYRDD